MGASPHPSLADRGSATARDRRAIGDGTHPGGPTVTIEDQIQEAVRSAVREEIRAVVLELLPEAIRRATEPEFVSREAAADVIGCSVRSLDYRLKSGALPYVRRGRRVLIASAALRAYLDAARVPAHPQT